MSDKKIVKVFTMEQQFPCGPKSSCCGPIGQSEQEVMTLKNAIENLGIDVEICNIQKMNILQEYPQVFRLFRSFGPMSIPIIAVGDEVVCVGQSEVGGIISTIKSKI